jgi:hypothetical protein
MGQPMLPFAASIARSMVVVLALRTRKLAEFRVRRFG